MKINGIQAIRNKSGATIGVAPGGRIELAYGDTLRIYVSFEYRGSAQTVTLYGSIGKRRMLVGFDEILYSEVGIELPESPTEFTLCSKSVDILITSGISPGTDYDLYCKIVEYAEAGLPEVDDIIDIVGIAPEYKLVKDVLGPYAYVYEGNAETCVFEFKLLPEQLEVVPGMEAFTEWLVNKLIEGSISGLEEQKSRLLGIKLYRDTTPALWTDYRCEVTATASPLYWLVIVGIVVALLLVLTYAVIFPIHKLFFKPPPLSEEIKRTWGRDTLISVIGDFEEKLERTPMPSGDLNKMSDQELRDYCDGLAEEIAPPKAPSWLPIAVLGGLGVAAVVALKPKTKKP